MGPIWARPECQIVWQLACMAGDSVWAGTPLKFRDSILEIKRTFLTKGQETPYLWSAVSNWKHAEFMLWRINNPCSYSDIINIVGIIPLGMNCWPSLRQRLDTVIHRLQKRIPERHPLWTSCLHRGPSLLFAPLVSLWVILTQFFFSSFFCV